MPFVKRYVETGKGELPRIARRYNYDSLTSTHTVKQRIALSNTAQTYPRSTSRYTNE